MTARELIIHIGHSETGTQALQRALYASRKQLSNHNILFPALPPHSGDAVILGYHLLEDPADSVARSNWLEMERDEARATSHRAWSDLRTMVTNTQTETVIISSENFFKLITPQTVARLDTITSEIAQTKKIVAYLSAPDQYFICHLQHRLRNVRELIAPSRTRIKERIQPLLQTWTGQVALEVFAPTVLQDDDIVTDFFARHVPQFDQRQIKRPPSNADRPLSAEAIALLIDRMHGRLESDVDPLALIDQIILADQKIPAPTQTMLKPQARQTINNWAAPDLAWLRDRHGLTFPDLDYREIDSDDVNLALLHFTDLAQLCDVNPDRKDALYQRANGRAKLPYFVQRYLARF